MEAATVYHGYKSERCRALKSLLNAVVSAKGGVYTVSSKLVARIVGFYDDMRHCEICHDVYNTIRYLAVAKKIVVQTLPGRVVVHRTKLIELLRELVESECP
ncbi:MAG: hypothetical protein ACPL4I_10885 [Bacteroidota bacterium]